MRQVENTNKARIKKLYIECIKIFENDTVCQPMLINKIDYPNAMVNYF